MAGGALGPLSAGRRGRRGRRWREAPRAPSAPAAGGADTPGVFSQEGRGVSSGEDVVCLFTYLFINKKRIQISLAGNV